MLPGLTWLSHDHLSSARQVRENISRLIWESPEQISQQARAN